MQTETQKNTKFHLVLFLWIIWITVSLFVIRFLVKGETVITPSWILSHTSTYILIIYLTSIPLTTLVASKGKVKRIKDNFANVIIFNLLIVFLFYCFYQFQFAYHGAANISYETVADYNAMTAFEYDIYYVEAVKSYYFAALARTVFVGLLLSAAYFVCKRLKK